ncbi:MAG: LysE family transporter [Tepidisphaeraceae bacterium]
MAGISLGFGAVTVDVLFAVATSLGLSNIIKPEHLRGPWGYVGVAVCFALAAGSLFAAFKAYKYGVPEPTPADNTPRTMAADYGTGFAMTALNLYTWVWWLVTVPALAAQQGNTSAADLPIVCLGVAAAASGWVVGFTTIINRLRRFAGRGWHLGADLGGGLMLAGFGFWALWRLL